MHGFQILDILLCFRPVHINRMPTRVGIRQRIVEHIALAIERLRVVWSPRAASCLSFLVTQLEPERLLVLILDLRHEPWFVEVDRQRFERYAVHTAVGAARHDRVRRDEAPQLRVVVARVVGEQPSPIAALPGIVQRRHVDVVAPAVAPRRVAPVVDLTTQQHRTCRTRRVAGVHAKRHGPRRRATRGLQCNPLSFCILLTPLAVAVAHMRGADELS